MASITALSKCPEIIYEILEYLSNNDILFLQRTCKSLYPTCHRQLWSALNLTEGIRPYSGRESRYTDVEWSRRPGSFAGIDQILRFVQDCWINAPGLAYTRHITFGRFIAGSPDPARFRVAQVLKQILEDPNLDLISADLKIDSHDVQLPNIPENIIPLHSLKEYSKTKSPKDFSIFLHSKLIHSLADLIDLEKVTKLTLAPGNWCSDPYRTRCWTAQDRDHNANIDETAQLLRSVPNLACFTWEGDISGYRLQSLSKLQAAFSTMKHLHTLKIYKEFFNRSFFLIPPESVKKLEIKCHVSSAWWQALAACPLTGVEDLCIAPLGRGHYERIGRVAVCGLKRFTLGANTPPGLEECLLRNNIDLEEDSKTASLKRTELRIELAQDPRAGTDSEDEW
ncbi:hypothetical protein TWF281_006963 [Arthrobotrys megalospora]